MVELTDQLIERIEPNPPCPHCDDGKLHERERALGPTDDRVQMTICTTCHTTPRGQFLPPSRSTSETSSETIVTKDERRPEYRHSGYKIMCGAHPAYDDTEEDYGLDDGSADYEQFVSA